MAQVGRISGPVLYSNLERNGLDLWFRNDNSSEHLLHFDVNTGRIGVNTAVPSVDVLDVSGTAQSSNLITPDVTTPGFRIYDSTFDVFSGNIYLNAADAVVMANMENGTIRISDNVISTISSNADIDLTPHGTGTVDTNSVEVFGNLHSTGNITFDGDIIFGSTDQTVPNDDTVTFNSEVASNIVPDNGTYALGSNQKRWDQLYTYFVNGQAVTVDGLGVAQIDFNHRNGGQLYVAVNGDDTGHGDHPMAPFATIARALQAAQASGTQPFVINVSPGEYQEALPLVVPPNVSIVGEDIRNCVIMPDTSSQSEDVFHLDDTNTIANITIKDFFYDSLNNTGHAFRFSPNVIITGRSPYIQNVTVLTQETSAGAGDAGRGAWIDGAELNNASIEASMLFHSCTFITPNADVINMTNGVRVEWLNSFTYYANRGLYAFNGVTGRVTHDGSTVEYGAELRSIGSANVYGNYGAIADGADCLMYLIQHNFGYIGSGTDSNNIQSDVVQANEVVELNSGRVHFVSTDQLGNFRVGNNFYVNLEDGDTSINIDTAEVDSLSGLVITTDGESVFIDGTHIDVGNIDITSNRLVSVVGDLNLEGGSGTINFNDNTTVNGKVVIRDNFSFGGTLNLAGDQTIDKVDFNVQFEQNFNPHQTLVHGLGTATKRWTTAHLNRADINDVTFDENYITSNISNADLELRASGTGIIPIHNNDVVADQDFTVNSVTTLKDSSINYEYGPELIVNGTFNTNLTSWTAAGSGTATVVSGTMYIDASSAARNMSQNITVTPGSTYDFTIDVVSATLGAPDPADEYYIRVFEPGVGTKLEWTNATLEGNTPQTLTGSFVPVTTSINIIIRASNAIVQVDNVSVIEDIGYVETITPVQVNITGTVNQTGNTTITGDLTQTGDLVINGGLTTPKDLISSNIIIDDAVIRNYREDLRINTTNPYEAGTVPYIVNLMKDGATEADFPDQVDKNLVTFLRNGTSVASDYAYSYVDVNQNGASTSGDYLAYLQYIANGTAGNATWDAFINNVLELLLEDEFANPGKYNSAIFLGDHYRADLILGANGVGHVKFPTNDVRVSTNLSAASIISDKDFTLDQANNVILTNNIVTVDDNYIETVVSNANLELRATATKHIQVTNNNNTFNQNLTVNGNTDVDYLNIVGDIIQTGDRNQTGDLNVIGDVTVSTSNIQSEVQFDDILINDNYIESQDSNANLEIRANSVGEITVPENDVRIINNVSLGTLNSVDINVVNALSSEVFALSDNITLFDNVIATTESNSDLELRSTDDVRIENLFFNNNDVRTNSLPISLTASNNVIINANKALLLPKGTTAQRQPGNNRIRFNTTDSVFEASSNGANITFNGVYSSDRKTSMLATETSDVINFKINNVNVGNVASTGLTIHGLDVDDISFQTNVIRTDTSNSDLDLRTDGIGKLVLDDITLINNEIQNNSGAALTVSHTLYGKAKFNTDKAVRVPAGTDAERAGFTLEVGTTRWNTEQHILETWDGNTYIASSGSSATISAEEMDDLILEYTLIFG